MQAIQTLSTQLQLAALFARPFVLSTKKREAMLLEVETDYSLQAQSHALWDWLRVGCSGNGKAWAVQWLLPWLRLLFLVFLTTWFDAIKLTEAGDASEMVINATPICADASSESCFEIISTWMEKCLAEHSVCSQASKYNGHAGRERLLPSDVIDLGGSGRRRPAPGAGAKAFRMAILSEPHESFNPDDGNSEDDDNDDDSSGWLHGKFEDSDSETDSIAPSKYQKRSLPSRVIDVGGDNTDPFLLIPKNQTDNWVALSHCVSMLLFCRLLSFL
jgi:hypothetical protein